jgi:excisionase family DNA binding protein
MSGTVFFDDVSDEVRAAAKKFVAAERGERTEVLDAMNDQPELRELVAAFADRLLRDLAAGRHPIYTTSDDEVSPAEAARVLGVSRQYVDRLIADGRLPFGRKPGSTHRTILVADVERLAAVRSDRRKHADTAITALLDGGLEY